MELKTATFQNFESKHLIDIGTLFFFKKFIYLQIKEGTHLGLNEMEKIQSLASYHYQNKSFGLMCDKNVSYSVNPVAYSCINANDKVKCIVMLKDNTRGFDLGVEKHFIKKPVEVFQCFDEATYWIDLHF